jgi:hypothetical protein
MCRLLRPYLYIQGILSAIVQVLFGYSEGRRPVQTAIRKWNRLTNADSELPLTYFGIFLLQFLLQSLDRIERTYDNILIFTVCGETFSPHVKPCMLHWPVSRLLPHTAWKFEGISQGDSFQGFLCHLANVTKSRVGFSPGRSSRGCKVTYRPRDLKDSLEGVESTPAASRKHNISKYFCTHFQWIQGVTVP